jgi:hypothetical protein
MGIIIWAAVFGVFGTTALTTWLASPSVTVWIARLILSIVAAASLYMCFATAYGWRPAKPSVLAMESALTQGTSGSTGAAAQPDAAAQRPSLISTLSDLAAEGRSLQRSLRNRRRGDTPRDLPDRVGAWERTVSAALKSEPRWRIEFENAESSWGSGTTDRLESRLRVLESMVRVLATRRTAEQSGATEHGEG